MKHWGDEEKPYGVDREVVNTKQGRMLMDRPKKDEPMEKIKEALGVLIVICQEKRHELAFFAGILFFIACLWFAADTRLGLYVR